MPYYEIHHIDSSLGHYLKNLVLVCANCHRQFTYANVQEYFNKENWLTKVVFNEVEHAVNQIGASIDLAPVKKRVFAE